MTARRLPLFVALTAIASAPLLEARADAPGPSATRARGWAEAMVRTRFALRTRAAEMAAALERLGLVGVATQPWHFSTSMAAADGESLFDTEFPQAAAPGKTRHPSRVRWATLWGRWVYPPGRRDWRDGAVYRLADRRAIRANSVNFLCRTIKAPKAVTVTGHFGSNGGIAVWLNGQKLLAHDATRPCKPNQNSARLPLRKGDNQLLVKLAHQASVIDFYFSLYPSPGDHDPGKLAASAVARLKKDFPSQTALFEDDLAGKGLAAWLTSSSADLEKAAITHRLANLGDAASAFRKELDALARGPAAPDDPRWLALYARACQAQRAAVLRRCPPIAFVKRHHFKRPFGVGTLYCWNVFTPGCAICVFDPAHPEKGEREIFRRDAGTIFDMAPSFDARKLLFAYMALRKDEHLKEDPHAKRAAGCTPGYKKNVDSFHIYEINVDGTGLRQITTGRFHDVSPVYLPDGRIVFTSTRGKSYSMCQPGLSCALFTMKADGSDIRRIEFSTLAGQSPHVLDDGAILFMRWEYQDKSLFTLQSLWTINPDGTRLQLFYGNTITNPNVIWQAKPIPGTRTFLCTLGPHHGNPVGAIGILDRRQGLENPASLVNITPEYPYVPSARVHAGGGPGDRQYYWAYRDPWPVAHDLFLVAYGGPLKGGPGRYRLCTLDPTGARTPLREDPTISCFNPVPLAPRKRPRAIVPIPRSDEPHGVFFVADVYQGLLGHGIARGSVKAIRILTQVPKRCNMRGRRLYDHDPAISRGSYYVKGCYGTVPVEADGSAHFRAPAGVELYFEALDADGKELCRMGSTTQIMPGENQSCIGCHEPRDAALENRHPIALGRPPSRIHPPPWGQAGPIDFVRHVQPVFDKHCVKCHSGADPKAGIDLSGDKTRYFNMAYDTLTAKGLVHYIYINRGLTEVFRPLETGSHRSKLVKHIESGHRKVHVDDNSRRRLYTWIDANAPYYSTYDNTRPGTPGSRDLWTGPWFGALTNALRAARLPTRLDHTAVNLTHPEWSSVLTTRLAKTAGGRADPSRALFKTRVDPRYQAILKAIRAGKQALDANPRVDMPGARPVPCPVDYGGLYTGFAGP